MQKSENLWFNVDILYRGTNIYCILYKRIHANKGTLTQIRAPSFKRAPWKGIRTDIRSIICHKNLKIHVPSFEPQLFTPSLCPRKVWLRSNTSAPIFWQQYVGEQSELFGRLCRPNPLLLVLRTGLDSRYHQRLLIAKVELAYLLRHAPSSASWVSN